MQPGKIANHQLEVAKDLVHFAATHLNTEQNTRVTISLYDLFAVAASLIETHMCEVVRYPDGRIEKQALEDDKTFQQEFAFSRNAAIGSISSSFCWHKEGVDITTLKKNKLDPQSNKKVTLLNLDPNELHKAIMKLRDPITDALKTTVSEELPFDKISQSLIMNALKKFGCTAPLPAPENLTTGDLTIAILTLAAAEAAQLKKPKREDARMSYTFSFSKEVSNLLHMAGLMAWQLK